LKAGDTVNLECDILGKYVARAIELSGVARTADRR
jgi:riboflavin synthase alpha subunit